MNDYEDETPLVRLARITRIEAHRRQSKSGQSAQVQAHVRKILDKFGGGNDKTKKGAFSGQAQSSAEREAPKKEAPKKKFEPDFYPAAMNEREAESMHRAALKAAYARGEIDEETYKRERKRKFDRMGRPLSLPGEKPRAYEGADYGDGRKGATRRAIGESIGRAIF